MRMYYSVAMREKNSFIQSSEKRMGFRKFTQV